jgi:large subunit ribosomal protein L29
MKKREIQELKSRPVADLARMAKESNEKLRQLRFDLAAGKVKNVSEIRKLRKGVARMKTFIHQNAGE